MDLLKLIASDHAAAVIVVARDEKTYSKLDKIYPLRDGIMEED
jgi:hypothetical protein